MSAGEITESDAIALAQDAYVFGYPLLLSAHAARESNRLFLAAAQDHTRRIWGWLDVGQEPWVLSLPETFGRYYVIWLRDSWHTAFASVGVRTTGTEPRAIALVGPASQGTHLRAGLTAIATPTRLVRVTGAIEAGEGDDRLAEGIRLAPASRWTTVEDGKAPAAAADGNGATVRAAAEVDQLDAQAFFSDLLRLSGDNAPEPADRGILTRLREVLAAGDGLAPALDAGVRRGREALRAAVAQPAGTRVGAWRINYDHGRYGSDYLRRAAAARTGLGDEPATDELVAVAEADANGVALTGRDRYVLRFAPEAAPPVQAFWSLSTSAGSLSDAQGLMLDADGALSILIQHDAPDAGRGTNWLPAPPDRFVLTLRLFWPREEALEGRWTPPAAQVLQLVSPDR
ncbi:DUF1214 domain-containing protein [Solirubrobacter soli]|uniref:DUF1214 domain-containing protein n=1 Tax=Solirubrobacter soli TaxID=363832 RepID=UPI0004020339|nr:DUF1214 domain-containing protein [Solirubrobacter soli]